MEEQSSREFASAAGSMADVTYALVRRRRKMSARWLCTLLAFRLNLEARTTPQRLGTENQVAGAFAEIIPIYILEPAPTVTMTR
jgi:hypothetical protein